MRFFLPDQDRERVLFPTKHQEGGVGNSDNGAFMQFVLSPMVAGSCSEASCPGDEEDWGLLEDICDRNCNRTHFVLSCFTPNLVFYFSYSSYPSH